MANVQLILLVFAFVFAVLAAWGLGMPRWYLGWASLACFYLSLILGGAGKLLAF
jgi:hypothetical protein